MYSLYNFQRSFRFYVNYFNLSDSLLLFVGELPLLYVIYKQKFLMQNICQFEINIDTVVGTINQTQRFIKLGRPMCLALGKVISPHMITPLSVNLWNMTSNLQLCFTSRPREAAKADGVIPQLTSGQAALTMTPQRQPNSRDHKGTHLESSSMFYWNSPLRPLDKSPQAGGTHPVQLFL